MIGVRHNAKFGYRIFWSQNFDRLDADGLAYVAYPPAKNITFYNSPEELLQKQFWALNKKTVQRGKDRQL